VHLNDNPHYPKLAYITGRWSPQPGFLKSSSCSLQGKNPVLYTRFQWIFLKKIIFTISFLVLTKKIDFGKKVLYLSCDKKDFSLSSKWVLTEKDSSPICKSFSFLLKGAL
jgi:hypothetical protein